MANTKDIWGKIIKTSALYIFGTVIAKLVTFLLLPVYTHQISTDEYGVYDVVIAYAAIIVPLIGVNCWQGMLRFTVEEKEEKKRHCIIQHGWTMLSLSLLALTFLYIISSYIFNFSNKLLIYLYFCCQLIQYFYLYSARGFKKNKVYALSGIISAFVVAIVSIVCIYGFKLKLEALYFSAIASLLAQAVYMECRLHLLSDIRIKGLDIDLIKSLYKFCVPESIGTIFNWLLNSANRLIIVAVLGLSANGIYAISNKFVSILSVFMTAFILSFQEVIYSARRDETDTIGNEVINKYLTGAGLVVSLILIVTSIIYPLFVAGDYVEGYNLIPLFYLYFFVSGITWIESSIVSATKKTQLTLYEKITIGIINFTTIWILIYQIGLYSSPIALCIAEFSGIFIFMKLLRLKANCVVKIPYKKLLFDFLIIGITSVVFIYNNIIIDIIYGLTIVVVAMIIFRKYIRTVIELAKEKISRNASY